MKKISIIVPIYNAESYLLECIESIINQTYINIEILLINDGSKDNSLNICNEQKVKDNRIIIINKENTGVSDTRNIGIENATGEYITFIDGDDIIDKYYIEYLLKNIDETKFNIANRLCFSDINDLKIDNSKYKSELVNKKDFLILNEKQILNSPCGRLYSRNILMDNKIKFNENLSLGEDLLFNFEYMKFIENVYVIGNELYYYRKSNTNSLSNKYRSNMEEIQLKLLKEYEKFFEKKASKHIKIFNSEIINFISVIVINEFKNKSINIIKRIMKIRHFLSRNDIKSKLQEHKHCNNKVKYYFLRYKMVLLYYIYLKIKMKI